MFGNIGSTEFLIIAIVVLLFFGSKKLNELARGLGESTKEVKKIKRDYKDAINNVKAPVSPRSKKKVGAKETKNKEVKAS